MKQSDEQLNMNDYQRKAMSTCLPTSNNLLYMVFNLQGEIGELSSKLSKMVRKGQLIVNCGDRMEDGSRCHFQTFQSVSSEQMEDLRMEAGDILWQLSGLCTVMGWSLEGIAASNLDKLASRSRRNVIDGSGDNR